MDLYTTSFDYPRPGEHLSAARNGSTPAHTANLPLPGSTGSHDTPLPNLSSAPNNAQSGASSSHAGLLTLAQAEEEWQAVQAKCLELTARQGCLVSATREGLGLEQGTVSQTIVADGDGDRPSLETPVYNYHISGAYQHVMTARGALLREGPRTYRLYVKVPRSEVLDLPLLDKSPIKPVVLSKLQVIAFEAGARISIVNLSSPGPGLTPGAVLGTADGKTPPPGSWTEGQQDQTTQAPGHDRTGSGDSSAAGSLLSASGNKNGHTTDRAASVAPSEGAKGKSDGAPSYGLETERQCEIAITGSMESTNIARTRCLVMLDELSGLHAECVEIDYKLQNIVAGRKRCVIQNIQEETATNIYFPVQLLGVYDAPPTGIQQGTGYRHLAIPNPPQPMSMQHTGQSMYSMGMSSGGGPSMSAVMTPHMTGNSSMSSMNHGGGFHPMQPPHSMHHQDHRPGQPPFPGQGFDGPPPPHFMPPQHHQPPHPPSGGPDHTRGPPFNGHGPGAGAGGMMYGPANGMPSHHNHHQNAIQMSHTGLSSMHAFQPSRHASPMPMTSPMHGHMPMHGGMPPSGPHGPPPQQGMPGPYGGHSHRHPGMGRPMGGGGRFPNGGPQGPPHGMGGPMRGPMDQGPQMSINHFNGPHPGLGMNAGEQGRVVPARQIWITGEFFGVQRARDMLVNLAVQKSNLIISRDAVFLPRKLDWILTERLDEVRSIMNDNGTYIQTPSAGSYASLVTVFGDHRTSIERSIRMMMALACQIYVASFWLLPVSFDVLMPQASLNPTQLQPTVRRVAHATGAEVVFKNNCFEVHGLEKQVRAACLMIMDLDLIHGFHHEIRFQLELASEHREFISGKKNGKINKIMKMCGVKIKFETFNDYNFLLDISGSTVGALQGLSMLLEELPAEMSFHLPEAYHKRIIGVAGRNIQKIMRAYGVYVKFSNAEEFAAIGGYVENEDNVVARTPAKNHANLDIMKQAIVDMVNPKDRDFTREMVPIPRRYHRTLLGEKSIFVHDIEQKTSSTIRFPYKESASDLVTIFGPESQLHVAAAMLLEHVPFEADLHVPHNPDLTRLVTSPEFIVFSEEVKRDHQIAIALSGNFGQGDEAVFKFRCQRSNIDFLGTARDVLEEWLGEHNIQVYPQNAKKGVDNLADPFSYFETKLLGGSHKIGQQAVSDDLLPRPRTAVDSSDVKALFEGPGNENPGFAGPLGLPSARAPEFWQPSGPTHTRSETESAKRDPESAVREHVRAATLHVSPHSQRGMSARTQSLDISSLNFSRSLSSGGSNPFGPMPPSPSGMVSSPNTATGPFFPSSHRPLHPQATGGRYTVDSITDGINNIQVSQHP